jgi:hypothetical protein
MKGYEAQDITVSKGSGAESNDIRIREYSVMAFARFYYLRASSVLKNDSEQHPPATATLSAAMASAATLAQTAAATSGHDGRVGDRITEDNADDIFTVFDKDLETKAILMARLRSAITPRPVNAIVLGENTYDQLLLLRFSQAVNEKAQRTIIEGAQLSISLLTLYRLEKNK